MLSLFTIPLGLISLYLITTFSLIGNETGNIARAGRSARHIVSAENDTFANKLPNFNNLDNSGTGNNELRGYITDRTPANDTFTLLQETDMKKMSAENVTFANKLPNFNKLDNSGTGNNGLRGYITDRTPPNDTFILLQETYMKKISAENPTFASNLPNFNKLDKSGTGNKGLRGYITDRTSNYTFILLHKTDMNRTGYCSFCNENGKCYKDAHNKTFCICNIMYMGGKCEKNAFVWFVAMICAFLAETVMCICCGYWASYKVKNPWRRIRTECREDVEQGYISPPIHLTAGSSSISIPEDIYNDKCLEEKGLLKFP